MDCVAASTVDCSMCGDVGFSDQLQQCKACVRVQHSYCSALKEGLETGNWVCDWCRLERQRKSKVEKHASFVSRTKEATRELSQCTLKSSDNGLEFLIKAVLSTKEEFPPSASLTTRTGNCSSNCSSSVESEKLSSGVRSASCPLGGARSNLRKQGGAIDSSISDEEGSIGTVQMRTSASCDNKRSPSSLRCSVRGSRGLKQKHSDVKTLRTQMSLPSRHNAPTPLKRLSSLKVLSRSNNITMGDDQSRGLVRRYKSLSDICY
ncbi:uncharacterized protein [Physcomitrium patens]|uniref:Zinc finger PHD-type domain-containing protein n=1 Tax=Physcomitrium patens TaxID=3218 RepID=A0A2K1IGA5_PHYPA|nr:uncharacterized protein LOC112276722 [Physcomitrium patens]XP_024364105.1 uncharacterized protein LOC112276722 [Physcomitrium patens]XP_024364106.1 uncharacterized protein LOC112276722 [Physcomitrium patens]XP_024364107.1 uncharacterized protein LOC112276722 [Physcomitrium patens]PNR28313.1 hypothetical protein PHYPA_028905 [Physcomitrium patens]|eukprot:XP_024364104.1 uncharacterized protein LOC112276722 [Physcomitrella patens]